MEFIGSHINLILNTVLSLIMFGLGLGLRRHDFEQLVKQPKVVGIGLFAQMILLPFVVAVLVSFLNISPEFKVGLLILSICPGGVTSNLVSYFAKGNVALAVSLTVSNAILTLFTIPIMVNLFLDVFFNNATKAIELPFFDTMVSIFLVTIFPASLGMTLRRYLGKKIIKVQKIINILFPVLLFLVFAIKFLGGKSSGGTEISSQEILHLTPLVLSLNLMAFAIGYLVAWLFQLTFRNAITIAIEIGLHNTALALIIAGEILQNAEMEKPALVYALYSFFITLLLSVIAVRFRLKFLKKRKLNSITH